MRAIKFRAWDDDAEKMIYSPCGNGEREYYIGWQGDDGTWVMMYDHRQKYVTLDNLMQYTGIDAEDGKEIYEGDIVETLDHSESAEVIFLDGAFMLKFICDDSTGELSDYPVKIIGNIYENPDLPAELERVDTEERYRYLLGRLNIKGDMDEQATIAGNVRRIGKELGYDKEKVQQDIQAEYNKLK